jgi:hypothetical protein
MASDQRRRESITVLRPDRESEGGVIVRNRGNARGAKAPCRIRVSPRGEENRLDESPTTERRSTSPRNQPPVLPEVKSGVALPPKVSELRGKLGKKAEQEYQRVTGGEHVRGVASEREAVRKAFNVRSVDASEGSYRVIDPIRWFAKGGWIGIGGRRSYRSGRERGIPDRRPRYLRMNL